MDIHNYRHRVDKLISNIKDSNLSKSNKKLLKQFHDNCFTEGLSFCRTERYLYDAFRLAKSMKKGLLKVTKDELKSFVAEIEKSELSPNTKHSYKVSIRKFYKSIEGPEEKGVYPERVKWLHSNVKRNQVKSPEELLTDEDIRKMLSCSFNPRDRALIAVLFESGGRIGEIGSIQFKDIVFDKYGAVINVSGKTGARRIRIVFSAPYLQEYINKHELNNNPSSYIWTTLGEGKSTLSYSRLTELIKRTAKRAGITKRIHPHLFRHSRATILASSLTEAQMKQYLGWTQSSKMAGIYVHMSGRDTDEAILSLNGIQIEKKENKIGELKLKNCIRCGKTYGATTKYCESCGLVLDKEEAEKIIQVDLERQKVELILNELAKKPEFLELLNKNFTL